MRSHEVDGDTAVTCRKVTRADLKRRWPHHELVNSEGFPDRNAGLAEGEIVMHQDRQR
jgi:hypothetical protein